MKMRSAFLVFGVVLASCSHADKELTADEHLNQAQLHQAKAAQESAQYQPSKANRPAPRSPGGAPMFNQPEPPFETWNLSDANAEAAQTELAKANAHLAAAEALESFENEACAGLSQAERASCPLFASSVQQVAMMKDGFKLIFKQPDVAKQTFARLRCHLAYAEASGFDQPSCPLFIKGTKLKQEGSEAITFTSDSPDVARALRSQAQRIFPQAKPVSLNSPTPPRSTP